MDGSRAEGQSHCGCGDVPRAVHGQAQAEPVEACDHEGDLRRRGLHAQAAKVRALHSSDGSALQEGARDAPGAADHLLPGHSGSEEESAEQIVLGAGCDHEGYDYRGERERAGSGDGIGKGRVG